MLAATRTGIGIKRERGRGQVRRVQGRIVVAAWRLFHGATTPTCAQCTVYAGLAHASTAVPVLADGGYSMGFLAPGMYESAMLLEYCLPTPSRF